MGGGPRRDTGVRSSSSRVEGFEANTIKKKRSRMGFEANTIKKKRSRGGQMECHLCDRF
jgi:hypothetical protein